MKKFLSRLNNQEGSMILIAVMLLVILTIMGITSTNTVVVEHRIALNEQLHKMAFYNADSGIYSTPKLIRVAMREGEAIPSTSDLTGNFFYVDELDDGTAFFEQIMGYESYDGGVADIQYSYSFAGIDGLVEVDVQRISVSHIAGGGVEFASGADGIGTAGGMIRYGLFSLGSVPPNRRSSTNVYANYRYVPSIPGGL